MRQLLFAATLQQQQHQLLLTYLGLVLGLASVQDVLHHIVAVLVLYQSLDVSVQLLQDWRGLVARAVLQDPLDDPAAVGMVIFNPKNYVADFGLL